MTETARADDYRTYYAKDPEKHKARSREWAIANHARKLETARLYREKNAELLREKRRQRRRDGKDKTKVRRPTFELLLHAKSRAKIRGVPFQITEADIVIPERCPALGIPLKRGKGRMGPNSPTLDRITPSLGYVPGNVVVISLKANVMKSNANFDEFERLYLFLKQLNAESRFH